MFFFFNSRFLLVNGDNHLVDHLPGEVGEEGEGRGGGVGERRRWRWKSTIALRLLLLFTDCALSFHRHCYYVVEPVRRSFVHSADTSRLRQSKFGRRRNTCSVGRITMMMVIITLTWYGCTFRGLKPAFVSVRAIWCWGKRLIFHFRGVEETAAAGAAVPRRSFGRLSLLFRLPLPMAEVVGVVSLIVCLSVAWSAPLPGK